MEQSEISNDTSKLIRPFLGIRKLIVKGKKDKWDEHHLDTVKNGNKANMRNEDGTITNDFQYSESMNRLRAPQRPYGNNPNLWSGIDVWAYHRKNNAIIHATGIFLAVIIMLLSYQIQHYLQIQTDFYLKYGGFDVFQHIPELKFGYAGIDDGSSDVGFHPGWLPALMMLVTNFVGILEVVLAKRGHSFIRFNQAIYLLAVGTILSGIPLYLNNPIAVYHADYVGTAFNGLGEVRNRTGYCHMARNPETNHIDRKYVLPPELRHCDDLTTLHNIQVMFTFYTVIVSATIIKVFRVPAFGNWSKEKLVAHGKGRWLYVGP